MVIFHCYCYVSLPEGTPSKTNMWFTWTYPLQGRGNISTKQHFLFVPCLFSWVYLVPASRLQDDPKTNSVHLSKDPGSFSAFSALDALDTFPHQAPQKLKGRGIIQPRSTQLYRDYTVSQGKDPVWTKRNTRVSIRVLNVAHVSTNFLGELPTAKLFFCFFCIREVTQEPRYVEPYHPGARTLLECQFRAFWGSMTKR